MEANYRIELFLFSPVTASDRLFHLNFYINTCNRKRKSFSFHIIMVRPPSSQADSLSNDNTDISFSSLPSESSEFTVASNISRSPYATTDILTEVSSNRSPYIEQYLNIYYRKSLDQSVSSPLSFHV